MVSRKKKILSAGLLVCLLLCLAVLLLVFQNRNIISPKGRGDDAFARHAYGQAITAWKAALDNHPEDPAVYKKLKTAYLRLGMVSRARKVLESAVDLFPDAHDFAMELARLELLKGDITAAEKRCDRLKAIIPDNPQLNLLLGDLFMLYEDYKQAEIFYRKALQYQPASPRPLLKLATALQLMGQEEQADHYHAIAEKQNNRSATVQGQFADYFLAREDYGKAGAYLRAAVDQAPENSWLKIRLAEFYVAAGELLKAEKILTKLVDATRRENTDLAKMLADVYLSLNRLDAADKLIRQIKETVGKKDLEHELLRGKYWLLRGNTAYAATHLNAALDMAPGLSSIHYYLAIAYLAGGQSQLAANSVEKALFFQPDNTKAALLRAAILYKKGQSDLSLEYLKPVLEKEPGNDRAHLLQGLNLVAQKAYDEAAFSFAGALTLNPENRAALYFSGVAAELSGKERQALTWYARLLEENGNLADVTYRHAMLLHSLKGKIAAERFVLSAIENHPDNPYLYYTGARLALKNQEHARAKTLLKKAMGCTRTPGMIYVTLARLYQDLGKGNEVINTLEACTKSLPLYRDGWMALAGFYLEKGRLGSALETMENAVKKMPYDPGILSNLAWLHIKTQIQQRDANEYDADFDLALDFARQAHGYAPEDNGVADTLGWAYYHKKAYTQAAWVFSEALERSPDNETLLYHYGMTLYRQGRLFPAGKTLKKALAGELSPSDREKAREVLEILAAKEGKTGGQLDDFSTIKEKSPFPVDDENEDLLTPQWQKKEE